MSSTNIRNGRTNYRSRNLVIETGRYDISNPTAAIIQEAKLLGLLTDSTGAQGNQGVQGVQGNQGFQGITGPAYSITTETLTTSGTLSNNIIVSNITGKNFILPDGNNIGFTKIIINKNPNIYESIGSITSTGNYGISVTCIKYNTIDGFLYVGGSFEKAGGINCYSIAKYNPITNVWSALGQGIVGVGSSVTDNGIDVDASGNVYIGGIFTQVTQTNGTILTVNNITRWNISTNQFESLGSGVTKGFGSYCNAVYCYGTDVYMGGNFTTAGGTSSINRITKYNVLTNSFTALGTGASTNEVTDIFIDGNFLWIVGSFDNVGGLSPSCPRIGKWNLSTNTWVNIPWWFEFPRSCIVYNQKLYVVGLGNVRSNNGGTSIGNWGISRFDISSGYPESVGGGTSRITNRYINDMTNILLNGTDIYAVGNNIEFQTNSCYRIAKFIPSLDRWVNVGDGINPSVVFAIEKDESGNIYAGGVFDGSGYNKLGNICRINLNNQPKITGNFVNNGAPCSNLELGNLNSSISLTWNGTSWSVGNKNDDIAIY